MKPPVAADLANDDGKPRGSSDPGGSADPGDHLAAVTLGMYATLKGLAAPVELLVEVLTFEAPADAIKP